MVAVNFGINERLLVAGNPTETARNFLAHQRLFRLGIAGNLIYSAGVIVLLSALYVVLRTVNRGLALLARGKDWGIAIPFKYGYPAHRTARYND